MTARLILTGRNDKLPRDAAQRTRLVVCPDCVGSGYEIEFYNCALEQITKRRKVTCLTCNGEGARER